MTQQRIGQDKQNYGFFSRYEQFGYTSDEAKRLLSLLLEDNSALLKDQSQDTDAFKFLKLIDVINGQNAPQKDSFKGLTVDENGNIVGDVVLARSFEVAKPAPARSNTLMHTFNAGSMRVSGIDAPEVLKNADFLSKLSGLVRDRTKFSSLEALLEKACPGWDEGMSGDSALKIGNEAASKVNDGVNYTGSIAKRIGYGL